MSLDAGQVQKIAHLARLAIDADQIPAYADNLSRILQLVEQMDQVDTQGIAPMAHPMDQSQRLRPDQVTETDQRALFQSIAPQTQDGLYLVPRVID